VILHGDDLPGAPLHSPLHIGLLEGVAVAVADAPLATYEGLSAAELALPGARAARARQRPADPDGWSREPEPADRARARSPSSRTTST
jgi:hypothetical protein